MKNRTGQVWKQTQSEDDGGGVMIWLVVQGSVEPDRGWKKLTHKVLVLELAGDNWISQLKPGVETDMDEHREGWWEDLADRIGSLERLA